MYSVLVFESSPTVTLPDGNLLVLPELSTGTAGREQGKQHWSLRPLVWGEWSLGSRHVSPDPTRTAGIDEEVFPATGGNLTSMYLSAEVEYGVTHYVH